jgi:hypothetical protein
VFTRFARIFLAAAKPKFMHFMAVALIALLIIPSFVRADVRYGENNYDITKPVGNGNIAWHTTGSGSFLRVWHIDNITAGDVPPIGGTAVLRAHPSWTGDGLIMTYSKIVNGKPMLFMADKDGNNETPVAGVEGDYPDWAVDDMKLLFVATENGQPVIMTVDLDLERELVMPYFGFTPIAPHWSPNTDKIVFFGERSGQPGQHDVYTVNEDGTGLIKLTTDGYSDSHPSWIDDNTIVFSRSLDGVNYDIYSMNIDGGSLTPITTGGGYKLMPKLTPDGRYLMFIGTEGRLQALNRANGLVDTMTSNLTPIDFYSVQRLVDGVTNAPEPTPTPSPSPSPTPGPGSGGELDLVSVWRFWSPNFNNAHFFTISIPEAEHLIIHDRNWVFEGDAFGAFAPAAGDCRDHTAIYRFYSNRFQTHFFTASAAEMNHVRNTDRNWRYEGIAYCADGTQKPGTTPLYRFWSTKFNKHFFTASEAEKNHLIAKDGNWKYEGIAYYVIP